MSLDLDLTSLSLPPAAGIWPDGTVGVMHPGKDVLRCWPHEYDSAKENPVWSDAVHWRDVLGRAANPKEDCGWEPFAMNYALSALYP